MTRWNDLPPDEQADIEQDAASAVLADRLADRFVEPGGINTRDLYAYAVDPARDRQGHVARAIRDDAEVRRRWLALLDRAFQATGRLAAAAASDAVFRAHDPGGRWTLEAPQSDSAPFEYCLVIEIADSGYAPQKAVFTSARTGAHIVDLGEAQRGLIQVTIAPESDLGQLIARPDDHDLQVRIY